MITEDQLAHETDEDILDYTIKDVLEHCSFSFFLPIQYSFWGHDSDGLYGKAVSDPLTIYATIDSGNGITFKTTFTEILLEMHEGYFDADEPRNESGLELMENIKNALLKEVERLDEWIKQEKEKEMKIEKVTDYALPCMQAEHALKEVHQCMLSNHYDDAIYEGTVALTYIANMIEAIEQMKAKAQ
jgi:hypothetical protein